MGKRFFGIQEANETDIEKFRLVATTLGFAHNEFFSELIRFYLAENNKAISVKLQKTLGSNIKG